MSLWPVAFAVDVIPTDNSGVVVLSLALMAMAMQAVSLTPLIGLWDFAGVAGYATGPVNPVPVYASPSSSAAVIAHLDTSGISLTDGTRSCEWIRDLDVPTSPRGCVFTESDYEIPSLAVLERRNGWVRIALDNDATRFGWVRESEQFHALADLLGSDTRLTYLTARWDRTLYESPGSTAPGRGGRTARTSDKSVRGNGEAPYRAIGRAVVDGRLWLRVEILDEVCGDQDPRVIDIGWVPAQSPAGTQWAWFWSRGC
jgi:hypothetical protein